MGAIFRLYCISVIELRLNLIAMQFRDSIDSLLGTKWHIALILSSVALLKLIQSDYYCTAQVLWPSTSGCSWEHILGALPFINTFALNRYNQCNFDRHCVGIVMFWEPELHFTNTELHCALVQSDLDTHWVGIAKSANWQKVAPGPGKQPAPGFRSGQEAPACFSAADLILCWCCFATLYIAAAIPLFFR